MNEITPPPLAVASVATIPGRGVAVLFTGDPPLRMGLGYYHATLEVDGRTPLQTMAALESARKVPPGEVMALLFPGLEAKDIPIGSKVTIVRPCQ